MSRDGVIRNWAGNVTFGHARVWRPTSVDELCEVVAGAERIRALGTGHSFTRIADCPGGDLVSVADLPPTVEVDPAAGTVRVAAGVRYGDLAGELHAAGYALHNLGSLPHISVAGSCATGTHGSGIGNGCLSAAVAALEYVDARGDLVALRRDTDGERFRAAVVGLGALGVVTRLELDIEPTFDVAQEVYDGLPWEALDGSVFTAGYSVSVFTMWADPAGNQVWVKRRLPADPAPSTLAGAVAADGPRHPIPGMPTRNCTAQRGVPGPWHERLPHFRLDFTPSSGAELQSEYVVDRRHLRELVAALREIGHLLAPVLQVSELRTVAADDLWLSMAHRRDSVSVHFTWIADHAAVAPVMRAVEEQLAGFAPRPHWAKLSTVAPAALRAAYPRWADFRALCGAADPAGKFGNPLLDHWFGAG